MSASSPSKPPELIGGPFCGIEVQIEENKPPPEKLLMHDDSGLNHTYHYIALEGVYLHETMIVPRPPPPYKPKFF